MALGGTGGGGGGQLGSSLYLGMQAKMGSSGARTPAPLHGNNGRERGKVMLLWVVKSRGSGDWMQILYAVSTSGPALGRSRSRFVGRQLTVPNLHLQKLEQS